MTTAEWPKSDGPADYALFIGLKLVGVVEANLEISRDGRAITVRVPLTLRRRGGRKLIVSPAGERR